GAGIGFGYVCPLSTCVKWFPKYKGLVTGISVAGFGGGAILLSSFANSLLKQGLNVLEVFYKVGLYSGLIIIFCALFLSLPGETSDDKKQKAIPLAELLKQKKFWTLFLGMFAGTFSGLLVIGNIQHMAVSANLSPQTALFAISALSIGNAAGRLSWGALSDRLKKKVIPLSLLFLGIVILLLIPSAFSAPFFLLTAGAVGFGFGGCFVIYTANTAERYGVNAISSVYPLVFLSYGLSGILGPTLGGYFYDLTGNYITSVLIAAFVIFSGHTGIYLMESSRKPSATPVPVKTITELPEALAE
ncbi:MAG: MFS transporter, partial [Vulcanimicrobiota bacterium]